MAKIRNLAACALNRLQETSELELPEARIEVRTLLRHALGDVSSAWLIAHGEDAIEDDMRQRFESLLARRMQGEPVAHILGQREFYGRDFTVTPDTLIPRPDTETLVEAALEKIPQAKEFQVLDLGTGSGAIAISIALERPHANVIAVDRSLPALTLAHHNGTRLQAHNLSFVESDWFSALDHQSFDLIVSNPPYIEQDDIHLQQGDLRFEPYSALASGADGLDDIRQISASAHQHLQPQGWLMLEHGYNQASQVTEILQQHQYQHIETIADLAGHGRVTIGQKR
ncbi:peptide chain release factor N(5)-glutamine methyltransferase [Methylobacillus gramineus]|uniref:peptide chain release factor N(5)-glutamine methyltransferase n=1 Tax=Methylobacillus gramineus TaxID=755169 RepID=UPI001CFFF211|nr:peptide chain release factor N(5)-glutamine methyltransferase [Methylobacillus gramineus]MCB5185991.1 peptide chain release factor N(5)-glutamine methyltransferase [Methylobacillus gramineus]